MRVALLFLLSSNVLQVPVVSGQFFLPNHPFVPPVVDEATGISLQRSPCPGLNTLANHGYINRNGTGIRFEDIAVGAKEVFGVEPSEIMDVLIVAMARGFPVTKAGSTAGEQQGDDVEFTINLIDVYKLDLDATMFREDTYVTGEQYPKHDETFVDRFFDWAVNGTLTVADMINFRVERIFESRRKNPNSNFALDPERTSGIMARNVALMMAMGHDPNLENVQTNFLRVFISENRIPNDYLPRQIRFLPLLSADLLLGPIVDQVRAELVTALVAPLDDDDNNALIIYISVGVAVGLLLFAVMLARRFLLLKKYMETSSSEQSTTPRRARTNSTDLESTDLDGPCLSEAQAETTPEIDLEIKPTDLSWTNLSLLVQSGSAASSNHTIISNVSGNAPAGQLTCILGPSGSGKTSLLRTLGGRHKFSKAKAVTVHGNVQINDEDVDLKSLLLNKEHRMGFVSQEDSLLESTTPREAIRFSARLRLPRHVTKDQIEKLTTTILSDLKLTQVQDRCVSGKSGLSGGEKRRLSLGVELVTHPQVLLLDEVTSGLDSHSAFVVVEVCREIARKKKAAVVMVIHQPNSSIFSMIDRVILMTRGRCMYEGPSLKMSQYFSRRGYELPDNYNVPDWVLHVSQSKDFETLSDQGFFVTKEDASEHSPPVKFVRDMSLKSIQQGLTNRGRKERRVSMVTELLELGRRELVGIKRNPMPLLARFAMLFSLALFIGICYLGVVQDDSLDTAESFLSHVGVVFMLIFSGSIILILNVVDAAQQRPRFFREYGTGHYRLASYAIALMTFDFIATFCDTLLFLITTFWIIGLNGRFWYWLSVGQIYALVSSALGHLLAAIPDVATNAHEYVCVILTPQLLLSGFLVTYDALPKVIRFFVWLQPLTYAFRLVLNDEFSECLDFTPEDELLRKCARAFENANENLKKSGIGAFYDDESVLSLMQGGVYKGTESILEYLAFINPGQSPLSLGWDSCARENRAVLRINEVGDGFCDITAANVNVAHINPHYHSTEIERNWVNFVQGHRMRIKYSSDLSTTTVKTHDIFLSDKFVNYVYSSLNSLSMAATVCKVQEEMCPDVFAFNGYEDALDCTKKMDSLPVATVNSKGLSTVDANSTGCRQLHSSLAFLSPESHCPHLSFVPMEDINNKTKCSESGNFAYEDFFSEDDFLLFQRTAQRDGIDSKTYYRELSQGEEPGTCYEGMVDQQAIQATQQLPQNYFCYSYLDTQGATGENNTILYYWLVLIGMWILVRAAGFSLLQRKAFS